MSQEKDEENWIRLEIKEITSIGKELIVKNFLSQVDLLSGCQVFGGV
jgi:hypothetical protein